MTNVTEFEPTTGMYGAYKISLETANNIVNWARAQGLSHIMRPSKMHVTTIYSRKFLPAYVPSNKMVGGTFDHFKMFPEKDATGFSTLVAVVHSPAIVDRWSEAQRQGATYDFPDYIPHISLGRVPSTFKLKDLAPFDFPLVFSHEYTTLKGGWGDGPSGYQLGNELMILSADDSDLYFVQPDGTFSSTKDRRSAGIPKNELPPDAVLSAFFKEIQSQAEESDVQERRTKMRGPSLVKRLGDTFLPVYRACPVTVTRISPMDYVTRNLKFATTHAEHMAAVEGQSYHVLKIVVRSNAVFEAPNPGEYFFDGTAQGRAKVIHVAQVDDDENGA